MHQDFDNETEANKFRDAKRKEGLVASRFDYGNNRFRVKIYEPLVGQPTEWVQLSMSNQASELSNDIEQLNKVKVILDNDFENCTHLESLLTVAKFLLREHWFRYPEEVVTFFENVSDSVLAKIKEMVNDALQEYEDQWNNKED